MLSSWRTMPLIMRSTRSGSTGRLRSAISTERCSLSRSNGTRRPERFTTISSRSCTRSKVVKRPPQSGQTRRRRMAECVVRRARVLHLRVEARRNRGSASAAPRPQVSRSGSAGSARAPAPSRTASTSPLPSSPFLRQAVEHLDDQLADLLELGDAEAARRGGRRAEADAGGDHRLLRDRTARRSCCR